MGDEAERFGHRGAGAMTRIGRAAQTARGFMMSMLPMAGGFALVGLANRAIELASSLNEVQNVVDVTFGQNAGQINAWAQSAIRNFGISELQAKQFTSQIGAMMKSSGIAGQELVDMSTNLAGLAGDFASFYNLPIEEAFDKIRAGIAGETEPLRRLGINMTVANLQAFALSRGITKSWQSMTQAEQTQLRYAFLMQQSADAQGDFNRTLQNSFANQKRVLGVQFDQFLARIATVILPSLTALFQRLNSILANLDTGPFATGLQIIVAIIPYLVGGFLAYKAALMAAAIWQGYCVAAGWLQYLIMMIPVIRSAVAAQGLLNFMFRGTALWSTILKVKMIALAVAQRVMTVAQWLFNSALFACPITWIIAGILALVAVGYLLYRNWETIAEFFTDMWQGLKDGFTSVCNWIKDKFQAVVNWVSARWGDIKGFFGIAEDAGFTGGSLTAPNAGAQRTTFQGELNIANAPQGSRVQQETTGPGGFNVSLLGVNA
jgi:hypothetical protein